MLNQESVDAVQASRYSSEFLKPLYGTYCFSEIPRTLLSLLGIGSGGLPRGCVKEGVYDRVILILIDGFGWKFLQQYGSKYPFLRRFFEEGIVTKITSQFPSTTAAHITTLGTGETVGEHGIYEWFFYEPLVDRVVAPLLYSFAGDKKTQTLESKLPVDQFLPQNRFLQKLQQHHIPMTVFQHHSIADSIYSRKMFQGATRIGYKTFSHALTLLKHHIQVPGLFYLYCGDFDAQAHKKGLHSPQVKKSLDHYFNELEVMLMTSPEIARKETALIVAADHGMIDIHPSTTYYLNEQLPTLAQKLVTGADGHPLTPAGSCRDFFLHVKPEYLAEVQEELTDKLRDLALVKPTSVLIEEGLFGPSSAISDRCQARMGNLTLLTRGTNSIWWHEKGRFQQDFYAMHGGLTPEELESIFLFFSL